MLILSILTGRLPDRSWPSVRRYLILGLFGAVLPHLFLFWVAGHVPAMIIAIVLAAESFIVFILAAVLGLEAPNLKRFIGLSFGLACVVLIMVPGSDSTGVSSWFWIAATLGIPFCYAIEDIVVAALPAEGTDVIGTTTGFSLAAAAILMPVTLLSGSLIYPAEAMTQYGLPFLMIACLSSFSTLLLIFTIRTTGAVFASQTGYAMTAGGILWSVILLNEQMSIWIWAALACLVSGLALVMPKEAEVQIPGDLELRSES